MSVHTVAGNPSAVARQAAILSALALALVVTALLSFTIGQYPISPGTTLAILLSHLFPLDHAWPAQLETIVLQVRLPRIASALIVGAALSSSGAAYQGVFRNPMVSPDILGVAAGASFGAAMAILLKWGAVATQASAFACGLLAVAVTYRIGTWRSSDTALSMILAGVIVGLVFSAFVSLVKYVADPNNTLPAITFWLMGSLASVNVRDITVAAVPILVGFAVLMPLRWRLNILTFGDEEAQSLGIDVRRVRFAIIIGATLMTAAAVAISGVIGLVGLVVPHLARMLVGPNYRILLPSCALLGSTFLLAVDDLARTLVTGEVPLGVLSSLVGAPFFIYLLLNGRRNWA